MVGPYIISILLLSYMQPTTTLVGFFLLGGGGGSICLFWLIEISQIRVKYCYPNIWLWYQLLPPFIASLLFIFNVLIIINLFFFVFYYSYNVFVNALQHPYVYGVLVFEAMATFIGQVSVLSLIAIFGAATTAMVNTHLFSKLHFHIFILFILLFYVTMKFA